MPVNNDMRPDSVRAARFVADIASVSSQRLREALDSILELDGQVNVRDLPLLNKSEIPSRDLDLLVRKHSDIFSDNARRRLVKDLEATAAPVPGSDLFDGKIIPASRGMGARVGGKRTCAWVSVFGRVRDDGSVGPPIDFMIRSEGDGQLSVRYRTPSDGECVAHVAPDGSFSFDGEAYNRAGRNHIQFAGKLGTDGTVTIESFQDILKRNGSWSSAKERHDKLAAPATTKIYDVGLQSNNGWRNSLGNSMFYHGTAPFSAFQVKVQSQAGEESSITLYLDGNQIWSGAVDADKKLRHTLSRGCAFELQATIGSKKVPLRGHFESGNLVIDSAGDFRATDAGLDVHARRELELTKKLSYNNRRYYNVTSVFTTPLKPDSEFGSAFLAAISECPKDKPLELDASQLRAALEGLSPVDFSGRKDEWKATQQDIRDFRNGPAKWLLTDEALSVLDAWMTRPAADADLAIARSWSVYGGYMPYGRTVFTDHPQEYALNRKPGDPVRLRPAAKMDEDPLTTDNDMLLAINTHKNKDPNLRFVTVDRDPDYGTPIFRYLDNQRNTVLFDHPAEDIAHPQGVDGLSAATVATFPNPLEPFGGYVGPEQSDAGSRRLVVELNAALKKSIQGFGSFSIRKARGADALIVSSSRTNWDGETQESSSRVSGWLPDEQARKSLNEFFRGVADEGKPATFGSQLGYESFVNDCGERRVREYLVVSAAIDGKMARALKVPLRDLRGNEGSLHDPSTEQGIDFPANATSVVDLSAGEGASTGPVSWSGIPEGQINQRLQYSIKGYVDFRRNRSITGVPQRPQTQLMPEFSVVGENPGEIVVRFEGKDIKAKAARDGSVELRGSWTEAPWHVAFEADGRLQDGTFVLTRYQTKHAAGNTTNKFTFNGAAWPTRRR